MDCMLLFFLSVLHAVFWLITKHLLCCVLVKLGASRLFLSHTNCLRAHVRSDKLITLKKSNTLLVNIFLIKIGFCELILNQTFPLQHHPFMICSPYSPEPCINLTLTILTLTLTLRFLLQRSAKQQIKH